MGRTFGAWFGTDGARFAPGSASAGARRGHFNTKGTKITKGTKKSCGAFAAEAAGDQPGDDLKASFALFVSFVLTCPRPPRIQSFAAESMTQSTRATGAHRNLCEQSCDPV